MYALIVAITLISVVQIRQTFIVTRSNICLLPMSERGESVTWLLFLPTTTTTNRPQSIKNQEELEMCSQLS